MKFRKVVILLTLLSLWGGSLLFADSATQKVRVIINGIEQDDGGLIADSRTYLPLREIASTLQAIVEWDNQSKRATVYKPNVHMFLFQNNTVFGNVDKGYQGSFKVFAQIDNLKTDIAAVRVSIFDPGGKEKVIQTENVSPKSDNFWYATDHIDYKFESSGKYPIRFSIKPRGSDEWTVVSEKLISSR
ncbi:copper amine oxidase N-terminal domain-containing protein [Paenibacillus alkaliterrae]|uniref:stalk domain-containing protein n=1 Tax=Paenibacillus alkaliterrae TaxID=320909 RepID=UPI001F1CC7F3|nr:stalk domain-containing protein [Paenibacillus alkaliterrae]MCF2936844.1 copper amine oxidase N-terminal domain-containing protein [Paenibacillus alkaliterrae]